MTETSTLILTAVRLIVLGLGVGITYVSFKAYRRNRSRYLRDASLGFGIITVGVFIEGVLYEFGGLDLTTVHIVESVAVGVGFIVLYISLRR